MEIKRSYQSHDSMRTNELSLTPGGSIVSVQYAGGHVVEYNKVKSPKAYITKILEKSADNIVAIFVNNEQVYPHSAT